MGPATTTSLRRRRAAAMSSVGGCLIMLLIGHTTAFTIPMHRMAAGVTAPATWLRSTAAPGAAEAAGSTAAAAAKRPKREINVGTVVESSSGYMARVEVSNFNVKSQHTVTASKDLVGETLTLAGKVQGEYPMEDYFKAVFRFMTNKGMPLANTEGMIDAGVFPVNLFAVKQLTYFHPDAVEGVAAIIKAAE